jgi:hypothetical protein
MQYFSFFIRVLLLLTVPSFTLYPHVEIRTINDQSPKACESAIYLRELHLLSYDNIVDFINELEDGELEKRYDEDDLKRVNHFLVTLAMQGVLPNDKKSVLEKDIQELLYGEDISDNCSFSFGYDGAFKIMSTVSTDQREIMLCGWMSKQWHRAKEFAKKHKKAIIVGAVLVVATITVVGLVAASSTAGAAAAGAAASSRSDKKEADDSAHGDSSALPPVAPSEALKDTVSALSASHEAPHLKAALDEHIDPFKEQLAENQLLQTSDPSFGDTARILGAKLTHQTFDGVSKLASVFPELCEEIKGVSNRLLPENQISTESVLTTNPKENYEKMIAAGHEKIDEIFSTNQAQHYTPEAEENHRLSDFTIGILPPPGSLFGASINFNKLSEAGKDLDRAGLTKAGRGLMKHGYREGSVFSKPTGNPAQVNEQGQKILESILNHPEKKVVYKNTSNFGEVMDIHAPGIGGARFNSSGEMIGFLEP